MLGCCACGWLCFTSPAPVGELVWMQTPCVLAAAGCDLYLCHVFVESFCGVCVCVSKGVVLFSAVVPCCSSAGTLVVTGLHGLFGDWR